MAYGGGHGGRTRMGTKVLLNLYDVGDAGRNPANDLLYAVGFGLHHSGVEVLGSEYSFASGGGIFDCPPRQAPGAAFRETIDMGTFEGGQSELRVVLDDLRNGFGPSDYNLIKKNCNHFANALVWALLRRQIPPHVNRLADIGNCLSCLLPRKMLEDSPVGPNGGGGGGQGEGGAGFQVYRGTRGSSASSSGGAAAPAAAFMGRGSKLGSASEEDGGGGGGGGSGGSGGMTDRREKARQAALARLERNAAEGA